MEVELKKDLLIEDGGNCGCKKHSSAVWNIQTDIDVSVNDFVAVGFGDSDAVDCGCCVGHGGGLRRYRKGHKRENTILNKVLAVAARVSLQYNRRKRRCRELFRSVETTIDIVVLELEEEMVLGIKCGEECMASSASSVPSHNSATVIASRHRLRIMEAVPCGPSTHARLLVLLGNVQGQQCFLAVNSQHGPLQKSVQRQAACRSTR